MSVKLIEQRFCDECETEDVQARCRCQMCSADLCFDHSATVTVTKRHLAPTHYSLCTQCTDHVMGIMQGEANG